MGYIRINQQQISKKLIQHSLNIKATQLEVAFFFESIQITKTKISSILK